MKDAYVNLSPQASWLLHVHAHGVQVIATSFTFPGKVACWTLCLQWAGILGRCHLRDFSHNVFLALLGPILTVHQVTF